MFSYCQSSGSFQKNGFVVAIGWAGHGVGYNNPEAQELHNIGPLPCGMYTIEPMEAHHPILGINVLRLFPDPKNQMFGRSGFFIHGATEIHPELSSDGCIILPHDARLAIERERAAGNNQLFVYD